MNPKEIFHNTVFSVQLPYKAGHSLKKKTHSYRDFPLRKEFFLIKNVEVSKFPPIVSTAEMCKSLENTLENI